MRVGVDLDGCLYSFGDSVYRYLCSIGKGDLWKSGPTPKPFWDFYKDWGWTGEQFVQMCNDGVDAGYIFRGPARPNARNAISEIKEMGHTIIIITDRSFGTTPDASHKATLAWLAEHQIPFDEIYFSADKTLVPTDIFVEDKLENYDALTAAGTECWLINRAWNFVDGGDARLRIDDIRQFPACVFQSTKNRKYDIIVSKG